MAVKIPRVKKKRSLKSKLVAAAAGAAALGAVAFLGFSNWRIYSDRQKMQAQVDTLLEQIQILEERRQVLQAGLNAAQGEDFQEEKMRDQGYKKPGEEVIAVLQDKPADAAGQDAVESGGFWQDLWEKISNIK